MRSIWENNFYNIQPALAWTFKFNFNNFFTLKDFKIKYIGTSEVMLSSSIYGDNEIGSIEDDNNITGMIVTSNRKIIREKLFDADEYLPSFEIIDNGTLYAKTLADAAVNISVGERTIDQADLYYGGLNFKKTTRVNNNGTFTIQFNENEDYLVSQILEKLYYLFNSDKYYFINGNTFSEDTYEANDHDFSISVKMYNNQSNQKKYILSDSDFEDDYLEYKFVNCKLIGIESFNLSYESTDTIVRNATFSYDFMYFNNYIDEDIKNDELAEL